MRVYFAGPLFTPYERGFIDEYAARLREAGIEVFVPHEHELATAKTTAAAIFAKDLEGHVMRDALDEDFKKRHPPSVVDTYGGVERPAAPTQTELDRNVLERLRSLGYIN